MYDFFKERVSGSISANIMGREPVMSRIYFLSFSF